MAEGERNKIEKESPQSITEAAKAFVASPNASSVYVRAVSSTVATMVSVIDAKVERESTPPEASTAGQNSSTTPAQASTHPLEVDGAS